MDERLPDRTDSHGRCNAISLHWDVPDGEITLSVTTDRALPSSRYGKLMAIAEAIGKLAADMTTEGIETGTAESDDA